MSERIFQTSNDEVAAVSVGAKGGPVIELHVGNEYRRLSPREALDLAIALHRWCEKKHGEGA